MNGENIFRYAIHVTGRVQGVGFRYSVQMIAVKYLLTGWVKNLDDGKTVDIEIQGNQNDLDRFIKYIEDSRFNSFVRIDDYSIEKIETVNTEKSFKIKY